MQITERIHLLACPHARERERERGKWEEEEKVEEGSVKVLSCAVASIVRKQALNLN